MEALLLVARIDDEFPFMIAIEMRWRSHVVSLLSPDLWVILLPISEINLLELLPQTPVVSTARGSNLYLLSRSL